MHPVAARYISSLRVCKFPHISGYCLSTFANVRTISGLGKPQAEVTWQDDSCVTEGTKPLFRRFREEGGCVHPVMVEALSGCTRNAAVALLPQLTGANALAFAGQSAAAGTLLHAVLETKRQHADKVLLVRVGEFYEASGADAVLVVEHCGLNAMGGRARAGCRLGQIQEMLDGLTSVGLSAVVVEEVSSAAEPAAKRSGLKKRTIAGVITPANPVYLFGLRLRGDDLGFVRAGCPYVGIDHVVRGFTVVQIDVLAREIRVREHLTWEAVRAALSAEPPASPVFVTDGLRGTDFRSSEGSGVMAAAVSGRGTRSSVQALSSLLPTGVSTIRMSTGDPADSSALDSGTAALLELSGLDARVRGHVTSMLQHLRKHLSTPLFGEAGAPSSDEDTGIGGRDDAGEAASNDTNALSDDQSVQEPFAGLRLVHHQLPSAHSTEKLSGSFSAVDRPQPLYVGAAQQLGLLPSPGVPDLCDILLSCGTTSPPAYALQFMRRWLLAPPPGYVAQAMNELLALLLEGERGGTGGEGMRAALPEFQPPSVAKVLALVGSGQANCSLYRELLRLLAGLSAVCGPKAPWRLLLPPLTRITAYQSGLPAHALADGVPQLRVRIEAVVPFSPEAEDQVSVDALGLVPDAFFRKAETFRGSVHPHTVASPYAELRACVDSLLSALHADFAPVLQFAPTNSQSSEPTKQTGSKGLSPYLLIHDLLNSSLHLQRRPRRFNVESSTVDDALEPALDRFGRRLPNRFTTKRVAEAVSAYHSAAATALRAVDLVLLRLSRSLAADGSLAVLAQACHAGCILGSTFLHARTATRRQWNLPTMLPPPSPSSSPSLSSEPVTESSSPSSASSPRSLLSSSKPAMAAPSPDATADTPGWIGLTPYWMPRGVAHVVQNDICLQERPPAGVQSVAQSLWLLTAPNMAGKSTLLRSIAAAALAGGMCGMCVPADKGSFAVSYDALFLRTAGGSDSPLEGRSAFFLEAMDVKNVLRDATKHSLVLLDEVGRGTSSIDGTAVAGAILEELDAMGCCGVFATHLHDLFSLPLRLSPRIADKRLAIALGDNGEEEAEVAGADVGELTGDSGECRSDPPTNKRRDAQSDASGDDGPEVRWLYRVEDGRCLDSQAVAVAAAAGLPASVLRRTAQLRHTMQHRQQLLMACIEPTLRPSPSPSSSPSLSSSSSTSSSFTLEALAGPLAEVLGVPPDMVVSVPGQGWTVPPSLCAASCVYVLQLPQGDFYVGETDSCPERLRKHFAGTSHLRVKAVSALVCAAPDKSAARKAEAMLLSRLDAHAWPLHSVADARHVRFGS